jgi:hypothetical protein
MHLGRGLERLEKLGLGLSVARNVPEIVQTTFTVEGQEMRPLEIERGSIGAARRLAEQDHAMVIVRIDAGDVELLCAGRQDVILHQGS